MCCTIYQNCDVKDYFRFTELPFVRRREFWVFIYSFRLSEVLYWPRQQRNGKGITFQSNVCSKIKISTLNIFSYFNQIHHPFQFLYGCILHFCTTLIKQRETLLNSIQTSDIIFSGEITSVSAAAQLILRPFHYFIIIIVVINTTFPFST